MKKASLFLLVFLALTSLAKTSYTRPAAAVPLTDETRSWNPQRTWVYFVGLLEWQDKERFQSFPQKNRRDQILVDVLRKSGVPESQIVYLKDNEATLAKVKDTFQTFLKRPAAGDTVIVYFCGHGYKSSDNKTTYFATYDAGDKIDGWKVNDLTSAIEKNFKGSTAILMADNCYSGAMAESVKAIKKSKISYAALTSAHFNSFSTGNWTFTESLIYAFRGDGVADLDHDGKVTFSELEKNATDNMLFADEQVAEFAYTGSFPKQGVVAPASSSNAARLGERVEAYSIDGYYKGFIRDAKDGKFQVRYYGYEESDDEWVPADKIRKAVTKQYKTSARVNINWLGKWFAGTVLDVNGGSHLVSYDGYGAEYNEWVPSGRIKEMTAEEIASAATQFEVDSLIEAQDYRGVWYKSKIVEAKDGKYKVHYFGWSPSWDEWVTPEKIRNSSDYDFGRQVEVEQNGKWYQAKIIDARYGTEHLVTYDGYNEDEWVNDSRIRENGSFGSYRRGRTVNVLSRNKLYRAQILDRRAGEFYVHYEGYSDAWNEWVAADRIREIR